MNSTRQPSLQERIDHFGLTLLSDGHKRNYERDLFYR